MSRKPAICVLLGGLFSLWTPSTPAQQQADLLLRGGMLLDGTGSPARPADLVIRGGRIAALGDSRGFQAARVIDVSGLYLAPGFIDLHSHAELGLSDPHLAGAKNNLTQGITTVVVGQDGRHAWPLGGSLREQVELWRSHGVGHNIVPLAGQGSARLEVMGWSDQRASLEQAQAVGARVESLLREGAWGLSTGLGYFPGRHSPTEEVIEATRPVKRFDGFYISHLRDQGDNLLESIEETIRIGRATGVRVVATHIKSAGRRNWGKAREAVARIAQARREGVPIFADLYPYETSSDGIDVSLVPLGLLYEREEIGAMLAPEGVGPSSYLEWAYRRDPGLAFRFKKDFMRNQPPEVIYRFLSDLDELSSTSPAVRQRIRQILADPEKAELLIRAVERRIDGPGGAEIYQIERHAEDSLVGRTLAEVARARGVSAARAAVDLTLEGAAFTQLHMAEEDIITFIQQPFMAACTDGWIPDYGNGLTHPRSYGTFTRRLRRYVYDLRVIDLPLAIHTATGLPAEIVGFSDRGLLKEGQWADVIAFDPRKVGDNATYRNPHRYSDGIRWVLVNGEIALEGGEVNGRRAGRVLLKTEGAAPPTSGR
jgi:N-acyl-D-aspartate/D-glutamate deacylase